MNAEQKPHVYEPGKMMNCNEYSNAKNETDPKVNLWLNRFHTIRNYAIRRQIEKDMKIVKRAFMRAAKFGSSCTALLHVRDIHQQTVKYLDNLGFTFVPALDMKRNHDSSFAYFVVSLPVCCEEKELIGWIFEIRQIFFKAQAATIERHCRYIEKKFEKAAKKCKNKIAIHQNYLPSGNLHLNAFLQRYDCQIAQNKNDDHYVVLVIPEQVK